MSAPITDLTGEGSRKTAAESRKLELESELLTKQIAGFGRVRSWEVVTTIVPWATILLSVIAFTRTSCVEAEAKRADRLATAVENYLGRRADLGAEQLEKVAEGKDSDLAADAKAVLIHGLAGPPQSSQTSVRRRAGLRALGRIESLSDGDRDKVCEQATQAAADIDRQFAESAGLAMQEKARLQESIVEQAKQLCEAKRLSHACNARPNQAVETILGDSVLVDCIFPQPAAGGGSG